ncbi:hypothetical protein AB6A40_000911 [Gnathostoma spinigerum]|uniref:Uncharacterized protein n=1 Tax=Gnathostoma spinigerum TaxID=75299 RepID=A0ABD6E552_9BILA
MDESLVGFVALLISCTSFGFMFAPLRKLDCGDGLFVQWIQCSTVFVCGFMLNIIRGFPRFNPIAMIGGFLYATGNIFAVPAIRGLGIGVGMIIWGAIQVLVGWGVARFGLFGTASQPVQNNIMNVSGIALNLLR